MLALVNCTLIDGTGGDPRQNTTVCIEDNRFAGINPQGSLPEPADILDMASLDVMPGLIDCHLHIGGIIEDKPGRAMGKVSVANMFEYTIDYIRDYKRRRQLAIESGVTSVRSAGDHYPHIVNLRDKINSGKKRGPRIFTPGPVFTAPGGHPAGTIYKNNRYIAEHATRQFDDPAMARDEVKKLFEGGVDSIKAAYGDVDPMDVKRIIPRLDIKVLEAIIDQAHLLGLRTMVHCGTPRDTTEAVELGSDSIEHGLLPGTDSYEFGDSLVSLMKSSGTFFVPTMATAWAYRQTYPELFSALKKLVGRLKAAGVSIAAGTDAGAPGVVIGRSLHKELELLVEAGMSPVEVIRCATGKSAENLGRAGDLGIIKKGFLADLIAVRGDPSRNISDTRNIRLVIKDGKVLVNRLGSS